MLESRATNGGIFFIVTLVQFVLLSFLFDVRNMNGRTTEINGALVAVAGLLAAAELALFERWLGGGAFAFELQTGLGKAFVGGWAVLLIASLLFAFYERAGGSEARDLEQRAGEERQREALRERFNNPDYQAGLRATEKYRELKAARTKPTTASTTATAPSSRPATRRAN